MLKELIKKLSTKGRVVILVDEYDKPIINNLQNDEVRDKNRALLKDIFGVVKSLDKYIRFTFITGVSKFSQVSLFSGPNNLTDITMDRRFATMMGYTDEELRDNFEDHVQGVIAHRKKRGINISPEAVFQEIRYWYNGYRFSTKESKVYNPFSTLLYFNSFEAKSYWYSSGSPSFLIDELKKHRLSMVSLDGTTASAEELMDNSCRDIDLKALMYQTGYFTIKGYNEISKQFLLGLPNEDVRSAFINSLVRDFAGITP